MPDAPRPDPAHSPAPKGAAEGKPSGDSGWKPPSAETVQARLVGYEVHEFIAQGGMGAVYRGTQKSLGRAVAIKILPPEMVESDPSYGDRFRQEARSMGQLNHPGIVAVYDSGEMEDGTLYFIMEFIKGTDVSEMVEKQGRLSSAHAMAITAHVCDALAYAHEMGVVHRDIKPANIMVGYDGRVKVADFGLAKQVRHTDTSLTQSGFVMGTPHFVAPEALMLGANVDQRADIYAVGVMLYQMLTGKVPQGVFEMPSLQVPGLDPRYDQIISNAMREDREKRYQRIGDLRKALDAIVTKPVSKSDVPAAAVPPSAVVKSRVPARAENAPYRPPPPKSTPPPAPKKKSGAGWVMMLLLLMAGGAAYYVHTQGQAGRGENPNAVFLPEQGEVWVDGLVAYAAGDWKNEMALTSTDDNSVQSNLPRTLFWPMNPTAAPMRDAAVRMLWRWPERPTADGKGAAEDAVAIALRSDASGSGLGGGLFVAVTRTRMMVQSQDEEGKGFGDGGTLLPEMNWAQVHTLEVRAIGGQITMRVDGKEVNLTGYDRGKLKEGRIHAILPEGAVIERFEYANLDNSPSSPTPVAKQDPEAGSTPTPPSGNIASGITEMTSGGAKPEEDKRSVALKLLGDAREEAKQVNDPIVRSALLKRTAVAFAKFGNIPEALATARMNDGDNSQGQAFGAIAVEQAKRGDLEGASDTVKWVASPAEKDRALVGIVEHEYEQGRRASAARVMSGVTTVSGRAGCFAAAALDAMKQNQKSVYQTKMMEALTLAQRVKVQDELQRTFRAIVTAQIKAGDVMWAKTAVSLYKGDPYANPMIDIVGALADTGDFASARYHLNQVGFSWYPSTLALTRIAKAYAAERRFEDAKRTVKDMAYADHRMIALCSIAIQEGDLTTARQQAENLKFVDHMDFNRELVHSENMGSTAGLHAKQAGLTAAVAWAKSRTEASTRGFALVSAAESQLPDEPAAGQVKAAPAVPFIKRLADDASTLLAGVMARKDNRTSDEKVRTLPELEAGLLEEGRTRPAANLDAYRAGYALCQELESAARERNNSKDPAAWTARTDALRPRLEQLYATFREAMSKP